MKNEAKSVDEVCLDGLHKIELKLNNFSSNPVAVIKRGLAEINKLKIKIAETRKNLKRGER